MPLPLGHAAIGIATNEMFHHQNACPWWKAFFWVTILANLPDVDVVFGLFMEGNGWIYHRGPTHSIAFCLFGGVISVYAPRLWHSLPSIGFWQGFAITFSHVAADILRTDTAVSLFWPFQKAYVSGHIGWSETLGSILFDMHQDADLIVCSLVFVVGVRWARQRVRSTKVPPSRKPAFGGFR